MFLPDTHHMAAKLVEETHVRTGMEKNTAYRGRGFEDSLVKRIKKYYGCRRFQAKALEQHAPCPIPRDRTEGSRHSKLNE